MVAAELRFLRAIFSRHLAIFVPILRVKLAELIDGWPMRRFG